MYRYENQTDDSGKRTHKPNEDIVGKKCVMLINVPPHDRA